MVKMEARLVPSGSRSGLLVDGDEGDRRGGGIGRIGTADGDLEGASGASAGANPGHDSDGAGPTPGRPSGRTGVGGDGGGDRVFHRPLPRRDQQQQLFRDDGDEVEARSRRDEEEERRVLRWAGYPLLAMWRWRRGALALPAPACPCLLNCAADRSNGKVWERAVASRSQVLFTDRTRQTAGIRYWYTGPV